VEAFARVSEKVVRSTRASVDDGEITLVVVGDLGGVLALQDSDGTVAEGCAFPVAP